ncbi:acyl-CoA dehydrogenase family protein [Agromyces archimandritae]|uniref:Acyl-CoA dehydrogenase family protein n=1 Tax=Agromyces archimandritae TaxID=2781962 RepID=A0A975FMM5_9MICO|nr:acyl-CoA dehydrogenase family protein [Agromyces archimandritae]QTX03796.1 acyl-CoA dehydrogenase family protein [Agromyces archimandritae]
MATEPTERVRDFVRETVIPVEEREHGELHRPYDGPGIHPRERALRAELQDAGRDAGLATPQLPVEWGGLGLTALEQAAVFEAAGYSLFGPIALNIAAPDEGNMHLLLHAASPEQRERWLRPLAAGRIHSAFGMTEPPPGTGSDPRALTARAERVPGGWRLSGEKWFITGAREAGLVIVLARTSGEPGDAGGATMFLVPGDADGLTVERDVHTLDAGLYGGHSLLRFDGCFVPDDGVLGDVDEGFRAAQVRLAPARLTHCMRWLGLAGRAQDLALAHVTARRGFGARLADLGLAQQHIADTEIDLAASRALIRDAARLLDAGQDAGTASSIAKTFVAEAVGRIVDRSVQLAGGQGVSEELLLSRYWREVRPFRIYDGSSETHRWSIARRAVRAHEEGRRHDLAR